MNRLVLGYGWPTEPSVWVIFALGLVVLVAVPRMRFIARIAHWKWVLGWGVAAALLTGLYLHFYLRGGPRIIDATTYWLQARAMSHGLLSWPIGEPTAGYRGRFLLMPEGGALALGSIFPPGYPAVLSLGFVLGAPLVVGPLLAIGWVVATDCIARRLSEDPTAARVAVVISALCAAARYHTADTMSHSVSALCVAFAFAFAVDGWRKVGGVGALAWMACGWFCAYAFATRPVTALCLPFAASVALLASWRSWRLRASKLLASSAWWMAGAVLPLLLLAVHQRAVTGHWFTSAQQQYYALSDGPLGCFRYGFGRGVGCVFEHGPYVKSVLPQGFGLSAAAITTVRRLIAHLSDATNSEVVFLLALVGAWQARRSAAGVAAMAVGVGLLLLYVPFYFDASYPGAGARLLAEAIPFEHALVGLAVAGWLQRREGKDQWVAGAIGVMGACMLLGFAVRSSHMHASLRERDGARPMFDAGTVRQTLGHDAKGLLIVDTDHGFNLAFDPAIRSPAAGLVVVRARHDDHDRLAWVRMGKPRVWRYRFDPWNPQRAAGRIEAAQFDDDERNWVFEAESQWPPLAQSSGYAVPAPISECPGGWQGLVLTRTGPDAACVTIEVGLPSAGRWRIEPRIAVKQASELRIDWMEDNRPVHHLTIQANAGCVGVPWMIDAGGTRGRMQLCTDSSWVAIDRVTAHAE